MNTILPRQVFIALFACSLLLVGFAGYRCYRASCVAAEQYVANASDGPWLRSKVGFVIDLEPTALRLAIVPHWIFRFRNPHNGNESKRIYVTFSGGRAFSYIRVLDPVPLIGAWP